MHTIPLWNPFPATGPDGWHHVTAPGGYEGWWFDVGEPSSSLRLRMAILLGDFFSNSFLAAYRRFRRSPTRFAPPVPTDHSAVYVNVIEKGQVSWNTVLRPAADAFKVVEAERRFELKDLASWQFGEAETSLSVGTAVNAAVGLELKVARASRPFVPGSMGETPVPQMGGGFHHWRITSSASQARGTIRLPTSKGSVSRTLEFQGQCSEGHCLGTAPPIDQFGRPVIAREMLKDHACLFELSGIKWSPAV